MLTTNMEPVYGIILAYFILGEKEKMSSGFYIGAVIILMTVILNGVLKIIKSREGAGVILKVKFHFKINSNFKGGLIGRILENWCFKWRKKMLLNYHKTKNCNLNSKIKFYLCSSN